MEWVATSFSNHIFMQIEQAEMLTQFFPGIIALPQRLLGFPNSLLCQVEMICTRLDSGETH